jgi:hypothetical protein
MAINVHAADFAGLPCHTFVAEEPLPADQSEVAWRVTSWEHDHRQWDQPHSPAFEQTFTAFLDQVDTDAVRALVIGSWGYAAMNVAPIDLLCAAAPRLPNLRALFLGDITFEECEMSWIKQGDITALLTAYPELEVLRVRGADGLDLRPVRHTALRELAFESGGLPAEVVRAVAECELPALTHLELWLGTEDYGGDATIADLTPILDGGRWPRLTHLGLRDAELADEVAAALAGAPVVPRLDTLDLSLGVLSDAGAEALLAGQPLTHLRRLDLHHHYLSDAMAARLVAELPGVEVDLSDVQEPDEYDGIAERYVAVGE